MTTRPATPEDITTVNDWLAARGEGPWHNGALALAPGFIIDGLAAAWVFVTPPFALLECLVGNPEASRVARSDAIDEVVQAAFTYARAKDVRFMFATTMVPAVIERSKRHGFSVLRTGAALIVAGVQP